MSDPRNVAHAKKVTQEKKHHGAQAKDTSAVQPGKKPQMGKKGSVAAEDAAVNEPAVAETAAPATPPATLEASLIVLAKLKDMEFHSRANLERLAELMLTVEDELKQKKLAQPLGEVYSAQDAFQTKLTALIEAYKAECDRMQGAAA
ncbi:MAG: hypothetical protein M3463_15630 [Verrucomicrobiota bacterium]|nr:hypothetical protein [Verrucomicrobiota bacterium]